MSYKIKDILCPALFFLLTIFTRIPFTSKYLYHMDSVQFALALEKYDITVHQPHPPGYFLYVMLGRLINLFIKDANNTFIFISILFSGLAVVTIYYLGKEIFDKNTGIYAALIALTSPNLWFHGEVALTYVIEAFFSTFVALLCWRILKGEHKYLWLSVIALGLAGGIRQNTVVFLFPLWLFSVKGVPLRKTILSLGLLGIVCLLWFIPMVWMTGGWNAYESAFRELWLFNTKKISVFEKGWTSLQIFSRVLFSFVTYSIGAGILILCLTGYSLIRHKHFKTLEKEKIIYFFSWIIPSALFFLLIFIHPSTPGYVLIFVPALCILTASSVKYISDDLRLFLQKDISKLLVGTVIIINTTFFFLYSNISYKEISRHDRDLPVMLSNIKSFDPSDTAILVGPYTYCGYRHIMYYLPEYRVYQTDLRTADTGETRKLFWGVQRRTFVTNEIILPQSMDRFLMILITEDPNMAKAKKLFTVGNFFPTDIYYASGSILLIKNLYPTLKVRHEA